MVKQRHEYSLDIVGRCPVGPGCPDPYGLTLVADREIRVELILGIVNEVVAVPATQEAITEALAARLRCRAITTGRHSGVDVTSDCGDESGG